MLSKKRLTVFGVAAVIAVASCFAFAGCSKDNTETKKEASQNSAIESKTEEAVQSGAEQSDPVNSETVVQTDTQQTTEAPENSKYGNAEVYTNSNGNPAAKTESGVEVELTSENMEKLIENYQDVRGSGSEEERAILDQIQVLLEVNQAQNVAEK